MPLARATATDTITNAAPSPSLGPGQPTVTSPRSQAETIRAKAIAAPQEETRWKGRYPLWEALAGRMAFNSIQSQAGVGSARAMMFNTTTFVNSGRSHSPGVPNQQNVAARLIRPPAR